jgi:hypothetical protein
LLLFPPPQQRLDLFGQPADGPQLVGGQVLLLGLIIPVQQGDVAATE